jgi:hypothetical protein
MRRVNGQSDFFNLSTWDHDGYRYYRGKVDGLLYHVNRDKQNDPLRYALEKRNQLYKKTGYMPDELKVRKLKGHIWFSEYKHRNLKYHRAGLRCLETRKYVVRNVPFTTKKGEKEKKLAQEMADQNTTAYNQIVDIYHGLISKNFELVYEEEARLCEPLMHKLIENKEDFWALAYRHWLSLETENKTIAALI